MLGPGGPGGVHGQAGRQGKPGGLGHLEQPITIGPGSLRVDVIGGDRRDAAPVGDARRQQVAEVVGQVGRRLDGHVVGQDQPGERDRLQVGVVGARLRAPHGGAALGQEVLDDHLLHVAVTVMRFGDGNECVNPVGAGFADTDEDAGGERDRQLASPVQGGQTPGRHLVGRAPMGIEVVAQALDHHALRGRHPAQGLELLGKQRPGVGVGQQARLVQHGLGGLDDVVHGRLVAVVVQPASRRRVAQLGAFAQREQGLVTPGLGPGGGDGEHGVQIEVGVVEPGRRLGEGAIPTAIRAQHRQRDEHLGGERHPVAKRTVSPGGGPLGQLGQRQVEQRLGFERRRGKCHAGDHIPPTPDPRGHDGSSCLARLSPAGLSSAGAASGGSSPTGPASSCSWGTTT